MKLISKIFFLIIFLLFLSSLIRNLFNYHNALKFYQQYKINFEKEKEKNRNFKIQMLKKTNVYEVEKTIRNQLNLLKPDEVVVIVPSPLLTPTPSPTKSPVNWEKWLRLYQGKEH